MAILSSVLVLGGIGALGATVLYVVARKFYVYEDPRIAEVEANLAGANCGACGRSGCHDFARACVESGDLSNLYCPSIGAEGMAKVAAIVGCEASAQDAKVAVVKCGGTPQTKTPLSAKYVGPRKCAIMNLSIGDYECPSSCLGCGDCVEACPFDAIHINPDTGLPEVNNDKCVGCGNCVKACPRSLMELRPYPRTKRMVWVACSNCLKGAVTRKQCTVGCIGCGLCARTCPFEAITVTNNLAYIDPAKCKACGKCVPVCPTHAIHSLNIKFATKNESSNV